MKYTINGFSNYNAIKNSLRIFLCDPSRLGSYVHEIVYTLCGKWCAVYGVSVPVDGRTEHVQIVSRKDLDKWGIDVNRLHSDAVAAENRSRPVLMYKLTDAIMSIGSSIFNPANVFENGGIGELSPCGMFILTTPDCLFGAGVIAREGVLDRVGDLLGCSYFVLPSSIHEVLILPDLGRFQTEDLEIIVSEMNAEKVEEQERLSEIVQYYDRMTGILERRTNEAGDN